jgi:ABC-2 type transport system permease protein
MPMFFLSGAMFPVTGLPVWLKTIVLVNPLSYGVDLLREIVLGVSNFPVLLDVGFLSIFGIAAIFFAVLFFKHGEY